MLEHKNTNLFVKLEIISLYFELISFKYLPITPGEVSVTGQGTMSENETWPRMMEIASSPFFGVKFKENPVSLKIFEPILR